MLVALGVTGGIAAYKACEIVRGLDRAGVEVQVLMTQQRDAVHHTADPADPLPAQGAARDQFDLGDTNRRSCTSS